MLYGQKYSLFLLPAVSVGTPYQRGDDLLKTTNLPRALQALFFPVCKLLQVVFRVCGWGTIRNRQKPRSGSIHVPMALLF